MGADVCQGAQSCLLSPRGWGTAPLPSPRSLNHWVTVQKKEKDKKPAGTRSHLQDGNSRTADGMGAVALFLPSVTSNQGWGT